MSSAKSSEFAKDPLLEITRPFGAIWITVECRVPWVPDMGRAAATPEILAVPAIRMGAMRAGMDTPDDRPPRICAPAVEQARSVTVAAPAKWTFQFIVPTLLKKMPETCWRLQLFAETGGPNTIRQGNGPPRV
jgi:hypothetical protein